VYACDETILRVKGVKEDEAAESTSYHFSRGDASRDGNVLQPSAETAHYLDGSGVIGGVESFEDGFFDHDAPLGTASFAWKDASTILWNGCAIYKAPRRIFRRYSGLGIE
jgi:hypothetical protein